jgi:hypothetical protein
LKKKNYRSNSMEHHLKIEIVLSLLLTGLLFLSLSSVTLVKGQTESVDVRMVVQVVDINPHLKTAERELGSFH